MIVRYPLDSAMVALRGALGTLQPCGRVMVRGRLRDAGDSVAVTWWRYPGAVPAASWADAIDACPIPVDGEESVDGWTGARDGVCYRIMPGGDDPPLDG